MLCPNILSKMQFKCVHFSPARNLIHLNRKKTEEIVFKPLGVHSRVKMNTSNHTDLQSALELCRFVCFFESLVY